MIWKFKSLRKTELSNQLIVDIEIWLGLSAREIFRLFLKRILNQIQIMKFQNKSGNGKQWLHPTLIFVPFAKKGLFIKQP
nr:MAG TPA: hypothetical protein [Caudoviricetes sp.]